MQIFADFLHLLKLRIQVLGIQTRMATCSPKYTTSAKDPQSHKDQRMERREKDDVTNLDFILMWTVERGHQTINITVAIQCTIKGGGNPQEAEPCGWTHVKRREKKRKLETREMIKDVDGSPFSHRIDPSTRPRWLNAERRSLRSQSVRSEGQREGEEQKGRR